MKKSLILIPPSEGKRPGGDGPPVQPGEHARAMIGKLLAYGGDWETLLGVKGKALEEAVKANRRVLEAPTMPAVERYTGVVYAGIDYPSMTAAGKRFFNSRVRIVSALFGLVRPDDPLPDYKLKIGKLDAAKFWRPVLRDALGGHFIFDCLPAAHKKAAPYDDGIDVQFIVMKNGKPKAAGHQGKHIKGRFVRWLCENRIESPSGFEGFREDGYEWNGEAFVREE